MSLTWKTFHTLVSPQINDLLVDPHLMDRQSLIMGETRGTPVSIVMALQIFASNKDLAMDWKLMSTLDFRPPALIIFILWNHEPGTFISFFNLWVSTYH